MQWINLNIQEQTIFNARSLNTKTRNIMNVALRKAFLINNLNVMLINLKLNCINILENNRIHRLLIFNQITTEVNNKFIFV